uniref:Uncharacterized protein n=1 Tax=Fagus sylvatica TaxID=28930 RepID=A0A2N9J982_FAGSY
MLSIRPGQINIEGELSSKKGTWCGSLLLRIDNLHDRKVGSCKVLKESMIMHTGWSCQHTCKFTTFSTFSISHLSTKMIFRMKTCHKPHDFTLEASISKEGGVLMPWNSKVLEAIVTAKLL